MRALGHANTQSVFGRDSEVTGIKRMLEAAGVVTITGRGGIGKTTVAREVLRTLDTTVRSFWVPVAGISEPGRVLSEIAHALAAPVEADADTMADIASVLGDDTAVLAIDNAEHVLACASSLAALVERCPRLRILVTSRVPLRLDSERVFELTPLPDPTDPGDTTLDELSAQPAVALYCQQANAVNRFFEFDDRNASAIVELCRRLEGLPLAIELAAARAAMLPASEVLGSLPESMFAVLRRPRGDVPERHRGLRAAIEWTYQLLEPGVQKALRHLSVNAGTFDLQSAVTLIATEEGCEHMSEEALDALTTLVDFHLVEPVAGADPARFGIPDSIRAFALEELDRVGEARDVGIRRIRTRASQARVAAEGSECHSNEIVLGDDRIDLLDALQAAIEFGLADDALDIVRGLGSCWDLHGYSYMDQQLLERALDLARRVDADPVRLAHAMLWSAYLGLRHSAVADHAELTARIRSAEHLAAAAGDDAAAFHAQNVWLLVTPTTGDLVQAKCAVEEGFRLAERNHHEGWRATIQVWAGMLAHLTGDEPGAIELGLAALQSARWRGDRETIVLAYMLLGPLADRLPDQAAVLPPIDEVIELTRALDLGYYEMILMARRVFDALSAQDRDRAKLWMAEALERARTVPGSPIVGLDLLALVRLGASFGDLDRAAFFAGCASGVLPVIASYLTEAHRLAYQQLLDEMREELGAAAFDRQLGSGAALSRSEALEEGIRYVDTLDKSPEMDPSGPVRGAQSGAGRLDQLTPRQNEVLCLLATGLSNKEIAKKLGVTVKTVMHHTVAIYRELGVRGRSEATAFAFRAGVAGKDSTVSTS